MPGAFNISVSDLLFYSLTIYFPLEPPSASLCSSHPRTSLSDRPWPGTDLSLRNRKAILRKRNTGPSASNDVSATNIPGFPASIVTTAAFLRALRKRCRNRPVQYSRRATRLVFCWSQTPQGRRHGRRPGPLLAPAPITLRPPATVHRSNLSVHGRRDSHDNPPSCNWVVPQHVGPSFVQVLLSACCRSGDRSQTQASQHYYYIAPPASSNPTHQSTVARFEQTINTSAINRASIRTHHASTKPARRRSFTGEASSLRFKDRRPCQGQNRQRRAKEADHARPAPPRSALAICRCPLGHDHNPAPTKTIPAQIIQATAGLHRRACQ